MELVHNMCRYMYCHQIECAYKLWLRLFSGFGNQQKQKYRNQRKFMRKIQNLTLATRYAV